MCQIKHSKVQYQGWDFCTFPVSILMQSFQLNKTFCKGEKCQDGFYLEKLSGAVLAQYTHMHAHANTPQTHTMQISLFHKLSQKDPRVSQIHLHFGKSRCSPQTSSVMAHFFHLIFNMEYTSGSFVGVSPTSTQYAFLFYKECVNKFIQNPVHIEENIKLLLTSVKNKTHVNNSFILHISISNMQQIFY